MVCCASGYFTSLSHFDLVTCVYSKPTALLELLSTWWRNSESLIPACLSSLSVCLQFHNCWLPWSHSQWAPDARYQSQPGSSSESPWPASPTLRDSSTGTLLLFLPRPPDLLLALHSPVRHSNSLWLPLYCLAIIVWICTSIFTVFLEPESSTSAALCRLLYPCSVASGGGFPSKRRETTYEVGTWGNATKLDLDYTSLPLTGLCMSTSGTSQNDLGYFNVQHISQMPDYRETIHKKDTKILGLCKKCTKWWTKL